MEKKSLQSMGVTRWSVYGLALHLGYLIVTPIVLFGIGGVLLDKKLDAFPLFTVVGFIMAMTSALLIVYVKMKDIIEQSGKK